MRKFFTKKKIVWTAIAVLILIVIGYAVFRKHDPSGKILTDTAKRQDLKRTVLSTGQVTSATDLDLSFKVGGILQNLYVKVGDKVKAGQTLAVLDQKDQLAAVTQARGALAQAQANYEKVLSGASSEDIAVAQKGVEAAQVTLNNAKNSLENTRAQQEVLVKNAYSALLNSTLAAVASNTNVSSPSLTISGTYTGTQQGQYIITVYNSGNGPRFSLSGLDTGDGAVKATGPEALGRLGLFVQFSTTSVSGGDSWTIAIPNLKAANYVTNFNAYQAALQTQKVQVDSAQNAVDSAQIGLTQAQASLAFKKAPARPADIDSAQAQILSAQGQVQTAQASLENTILRAPASGTITAVDIKLGEQAVALKEVIVLQDVDNLHVESNVSEANIANLKVGQSVDMTLDALGPDRHFEAAVEQIDPASTVISGVVNYKVKVGLNKNEEIKPGMTANLTVLVAEKRNVLAIPQRAVIDQGGGGKVARVITNSKSKAYTQAAVQTGLEADGGLVEIISGLSEGQEVVTFIK